MIISCNAVQMYGAQVEGYWKEWSVLGWSDLLKKVGHVEVSLQRIYFSNFLAFLRKHPQYLWTVK